MTIQMKIKNLDSRKTAIVTVKTQTSKGEPVSGDTQLAGGEEVDKYVHSDQRLVVEETQNG